MYSKFCLGPCFNSDALMPYRYIVCSQFTWSFIQYFLIAVFIGDVVCKFLVEYEDPDTGVRVTDFQLIAKYYAKWVALRLHALLLWRVVCASLNPAIVRIMKQAEISRPPHSSWITTDSFGLSLWFCWLISILLWNSDFELSEHISYIKSNRQVFKNSTNQSIVFSKYTTVAAFTSVIAQNMISPALFSVAVSIQDHACARYHLLDPLVHYHHISTRCEGQWKWQGAAHRTAQVITTGKVQNPTLTVLSCLHLIHPAMYRHDDDDDVQLKSPQLPPNEKWWPPLVSCPLT